jgi:ribonuclease P protein component
VAASVSPHRRAAEVQRRHRLSRSRDFDAVYRHGRSVSTRFLTLYWFAREENGGEPRLGLSVPKKAVAGAVARNRIKRRLRELWRARLEALPPGRDYVLIVRPGLTEAAEERGADWLGERVDEVLGKVSA